MINEVLDVMVELAREGMTMMSSPTRWALPARWPTGWSSWTRASIVEDCTKDDFFGSPRSERAQQFLSKILQH
jgi:glutamate/aspartate transport system ATP-binding protein